MATLRINRIALIVLDSVGIGALPDAADYGDAGANTLVHVAERRGGLRLPHLASLGLGNILSLPGVSPAPAPLASWGRMAERARGKDTLAGHWEMMGLPLDKPFALFPGGFPSDLLAEFKRRTGAAGLLGNKAASGTEIIAELGAEHVHSGFPIVYTSADSVFQIAAHEDVIPLPDLYEMCRQTRDLCDDWMIGRVIARPFVGAPGSFRRTANRRDFSMCPPGETALDVLRRDGWPVTGVGKIENIFAGKGIGRSRPSHDNAEGMSLVREEWAAGGRGLLFANLVDFDMLYGHRNDAEGYGAALEAFDLELGAFLPRLGPGDMLVVTADHGCDPVFPGTDHTREYVPLLAYAPGLTGRALGDRSSFADVGASILDAFGLKHEFPGRSFLADMRSAGPEEAP
ncbi:MAG: phosphopentomutase [Candidatus Aminicenantes bacterium]|nr:phosphopentomutase [Candidatus Aminicenantes bacterium]